MIFKKSLFLFCYCSTYIEIIPIHTRRIIYYKNYYDWQRGKSSILPISTFKEYGMVNIPPRLLYNMENFTTVTLTMLTFLQRLDDAEFD
jgi:hypothetical protein